VLCANSAAAANRGHFAVSNTSVLAKQSQRRLGGTKPLGRWRRNREGVLLVACGTSILAKQSQYRSGGTKPPGRWRCNRRVWLSRCVARGFGETKPTQVRRNKATWALAAGNRNGVLLVGMRHAFWRNKANADFNGTEPTAPPACRLPPRHPIALPRFRRPLGARMNFTWRREQSQVKDDSCIVSKTCV
jgi:hypothetical protein